MNKELLEKLSKLLPTSKEIKKLGVNILAYTEDGYMLITSAKVKYKKQLYYLYRDADYNLICEKW